MTAMRRSAVALLGLILAFEVGAQADSQTPAADEQQGASTGQQQAVNARRAPESQQPRDHASDQSLEAAYKKEFAFLEAQRRELQQRIQSFQSQAAAEEQRAQRELQELEEEVAALSAESDRLKEQVNEAERQARANESSAQVLESTIVQASATLGDHGVDPTESEDFKTLDKAEQIAAVFGAGNELIRRLAHWRRSDGPFYLRDGSEVSGTIIRLGDVAAWGVSSEGAGVLAPAGGGKLKLREEDSEATAKALQRGDQPQPLKLFAYESQDQAVAGPRQASMIATINSGGPIAWIIVGMGLLAAVMVMLRIVFLNSASQRTDSLTEEIGALVERGELDKAIEACRREQGSTSRVLSATIRNLDRDREHLEDIVSESILHESTHLNRFGSAILVLAAVSPLLGLLGTVTGMISTFEVITEFGTGDPSLLSGGISVALITTQIGLIVAVPTLLAGNLLSGWAESIKDGMQKAALRITNRYEKAHAMRSAHAA